MAISTAANGVIKSGSTAVAEITGYSVEHMTDTVESTVIGDTARTYEATLKSFTMSIDAFWDPADSGQDTLTVGSSISFSIYPEGETSGDTYYTGSGIITGRTISTSNGEMISASFSVQGDGDLTEATVS
jgi:hypothetical protein